MCSIKQLRISRRVSCSGTAGFSTDFERGCEPFRRSSAFDCLGNEHIAIQSPLRKTQSALDLTGTKLSTIPLAARSFAFVWRKPAQSQPAQEPPMELAGSGECLTVEEIKQRWRRQQIAIQQKHAPPEKVSIWSVLTRSRR
jgi:hypothetical protein